VKRYYLGVDWADESHQVWVSDPEGKKIAEMKVMQSPAGLSELGRLSCPTRFGTLDK
jgi:hypothetical protein